MGAISEIFPQTIPTTITTTTIKTTTTTNVITTSGKYGVSS